MHYNVLKRSIKTKNKSVYRWYYSFVDPATGVKKQRVIPDCHNRADAYAYIKMLPELDRKVVLIKDICKDMFIPGSTYIERLEQKRRQKAYSSLFPFYICYKNATRTFCRSCTETCRTFFCRNDRLLY